MQVYVEIEPETTYIGKVEDEVKTVETRMWFETDEDVEVLSLADHTKQVRKEVCEEIKEQICMLAYKSNSDENFMFDDNVKFNKVLAILDQSQGEK